MFRHNYDIYDRTHKASGRTVDDVARVTVRLERILAVLFEGWPISGLGVCALVTREVVVIVLAGYWEGEGGGGGAWTMATTND